jgi:hypothetical protein
MYFVQFSIAITLGLISSQHATAITVNDLSSPFSKDLPLRVVAGSGE